VSEVVLVDLSLARLAWIASNSGMPSFFFTVASSSLRFFQLLLSIIFAKLISRVFRNLLLLFQADRRQDLISHFHTTILCCLP
jgi:multisubunit Na+/H+ antiporter MnhE subunit